MESILVLGSEALCAELTVMVRGRAAVVRADESLAAAELFRERMWAAVVFEVVSGDSLSAAMGLRALRMIAPTVPALVILDEVSTTFVNLAQRHHAELLVRPVALLQVLGFVERAIDGARGLSDDDVNAWLRELAARRRLTKREAELLSLVLERELRDRVIQRWRVPPLVVQTELASLLRKCEARNTESLAKSVLVNAVKFRADPSFEERERHLDEHDEDDEGAADCSVETTAQPPLAKRNDEQHAPESQAGNQHRLTVLVVDDDPDAQARTVRTLRKDVMAVHVAASGEEALLMAAVAPFDIILLALNMPRMDGPETLRRLRADERTKSIPVVLMDYLCTLKPPRIRQLQAAGALSVVTRPLRTARYAEDLRALWRSQR